MKTGLSKKPVRVHLLTNDSVLLVFESKSTVQQLFDQVCSLLTIKEGQFFGLSTVVDNEKLFMDLKQKITKYAPKDWGKEIKRRVSDVGAVSSTVLSVQFQVQFYVEHPKLISDKNSRLQYYLQLRKNVLQSHVLTQDEVLFTLASHALQADMGDHDPVRHKKYYFNTEDYFPSWFIEKWGRDYLLSHLPALHAEHRGKRAFESQAEYIQQASGIDDVPVHYYKLYKGKRDTKAAVLLGIYHQGIRILYGNPEKPQDPWKLEFEFMWNKVGRLFFTGKRFEIYPEDLPASLRLIYYTGSHARSKYLLHFLRDSHSLYMSLSPYAQHMCRADGRRLKRWYHESYIGGKNLDLERSVDMLNGDLNSTDNKDSMKKAKQENRELFSSYHNSTTSHGSSHTSGIESDKQRAREEDEDDSPKKHQFVDITDDHLTGPPPKSLSVDNLRDALDFSKLSVGEPSTAAKSSAKPSRDSTLKGEDFRITADEFRRVPGSDNTHTSPAERINACVVADDVFIGGAVKTEYFPNELADVPYDYFTAATLEKDATEKKREKPTKVLGTKKKAKRQVSDRSTQTLTPQGKLEKSGTNPSGRAGKTRSYYSDMHTIPHRNHSGAHVHGRLNSDAVSQAIDARREERAKRSQSHGGHQNIVKQSSSAHVPADAHPRGQERKAHASGVRGKAVAKRASTSHENSADCVPSHESHEIMNRSTHSAFVPVSKAMCHSGTSDQSRTYHAAAHTDRHERQHHHNKRATTGSHTGGIVYVQEGDPVEKHKHHRSKRSHRRSHDFDTAGNKHSTSHHKSQDQADMQRLSSFEDEAYSQAMSDVCNRTLRAQRRKLSDSRSSQRMDSGRSSLRTTDESSCCVDVGRHDKEDYAGGVSSPRSPVRKSDVRDPPWKPFIDNYNEVIV